MNMEKEPLAVRLIAKRYEERGYAVTLAPPSSAIPFSLGSYIPTILASRGDEHLVIEVKMAGTIVDPDAYFQLDAKIQQHPGWRFLIATLPEAELEEELSGSAKNLSAESIRAELKVSTGWGTTAKFRLSCCLPCGRLRRLPSAIA